VARGSARSLRRCRPIRCSKPRACPMPNASFRPFGACCYPDAGNLKAREHMLWKLVVPGPIEDVDELRILEWQGEIGRRFDKGALIVELETHKAVVEVRA